VFVVYFDASPFSNYQLSAHGIVVSCLHIIIGVKVRMIATFYPHVEASVIAPASSHQISGCQILLSFSFVKIKHEEEKLLRHFWNN